MRKLGTVLTMVGVLIVVSPTSAWGDGFRSYRLCGGNAFNTCAAVEINVVGQTVTMRVWNLSQNSGASNGLGASANGSSILDGIAFFNLPAGLQVNTGSLTVSGPGATSNHGWTLRNYDAVGAFAVDGKNGPNHSVTGGIASGCGSQVTSQANLLVTPCSAMYTAGSWVTFSFQISGSWDPRLSDIAIRSHDSRTGETNDFWTGMSPSGRPGIATTVTPEPVTMTLLATGLAGMAGAGLVHRRRKSSNTI
jgi:hypothetical protein